MSGGFFDYIQGRLDYEVCEGIRNLIENNDKEDEWGHKRGFSKETLDKFKEALETVEKAAKMIQRVDWLVSGDDGEECFHRRWKEELGE